VSSTVEPSVTRLRTTSPCLRLRVQAGGRSSRKITDGGRPATRPGQARRMPPEYVLAGRPAASSASKPLEAARGRGPWRPASAGSSSLADQHQVLGAGQVLVHGRVLPGEPDVLAHLRGFAGHVEPGDGRRARAARSSVARIRTGWSCRAPFGPRTPRTVPPGGESMPARAWGLPEAIGEPFGFDGVCHGLGWAGPLAPPAPRTERPDTGCTG